MDQLLPTIKVNSTLDFNLRLFHSVSLFVKSLYKTNIKVNNTFVINVPSIKVNNTFVINLHLFHSLHLLIKSLQWTNCCLL